MYLSVYLLLLEGLKTWEVSCNLDCYTICKEDVDFSWVSDDLEWTVDQLVDMVLSSKRLQISETNLKICWDVVEGVDLELDDN